MTIISAIPRSTRPIFGDSAPGNLRAEYVLPRKQLRIDDAGVYWPLQEDLLYLLVLSSDHRLVWIDVRVPVD